MYVCGRRKPRCCCLPLGLAWGAQASPLAGGGAPCTLLLFSHCGVICMLRLRPKP